MHVRTPCRKNITVSVMRLFVVVKTNWSGASQPCQLPTLGKTRHDKMKMKLNTLAKISMNQTGTQNPTLSGVAVPGISPTPCPVYLCATKTARITSTVQPRVAPGPPVATNMNVVHKTVMSGFMDMERGN